MLFYNSLYRGMCIKATIVAYAFSVQCFENVTIVAYAGLRVNSKLPIGINFQGIILMFLQLTGHPQNFHAQILVAKYWLALIEEQYARE